MWSQHMSISTRVQNVRSIRPIQCSSLVKYLMMKDLRRVAESSLTCEAEELFTLAEKWALRLLCRHASMLHSFFNQPDFANNCQWWCGQHEDRLIEQQISCSDTCTKFHKASTSNKCAVHNQFSQNLWESNLLYIF